MSETVLDSKFAASTIFEGERFKSCPKITLLFRFSAGREWQSLAEAELALRVLFRPFRRQTSR
ncbi:unnamed protein product, partial [Effrenium voratum]